MDDETFGDERDEIKRRAQASGIGCITSVSGLQSTDRLVLLLFFPDGSGTRSVVVDSEAAPGFNALNFEDFSIVGQYRSLYDQQDRTLEVALMPAAGPGRRPYLRDILGLPGTEFFRELDDGRLESFDFKFAQQSEPSHDTEGRVLFDLEKKDLTHWRLPIRDAPLGMSVELSPPSEKLRAFTARAQPGAHITLKIANIERRNAEDLLGQMESIAASVLFELDVRFGVTLAPQYRQDRLPELQPVSPGENEQPITFPKVRYPKAATTLYRYGRAAGDNPLLRYLAYYQSIEHFFPAFTKDEAIAGVRKHLEKPEFDRTSRKDLGELVKSAAVGFVKGANEPRQMQITLRRAIPDEELHEFLIGMETADREFLYAAEGGLVDVEPLSADAKKALADTVAKRVYAIRCRIVHAKDSPDVYAEPLLPYSPEIAKLGPDLRLVEYLAQKVIIAGSKEDSWRRQPQTEGTPPVAV